MVHAVVFDIGGVLEISPEMDFVRRSEMWLGLASGAIGERLGDVFGAGVVGAITEFAVEQRIGERLGLGG